MNNDIRIRLTFNGHQAVALLTDNPTTRSLLAQLPVTIRFEEYAQAEKIADFPDGLSNQNAPHGYAPKAGDVTCYGPWNNLAIFYRNRGYTTGLIYLGAFESGLDQFARQGSGFEAAVELIG